jgi:hypothetical protein
MVSSSSSILSPIFSVIAKLTGEFTSLKEPTDDYDIVIVMLFLADGFDFVKSERQIEPREPMQKFRLPIVRSIS